MLPALVGRFDNKIIVSISLWLATLLLFQSVRKHDFINFDDGDNIYANEALRITPLKHLIDFWRRPYRQEYLPMTYSAWALLTVAARAFGGSSNKGYPDSGYFHLANVFLHSTNVVLVYWLLLLVLAPMKPPHVAPILGALVFGWHPIQVEAVAWATGLKDLLSCFFGLLATVIYLWSAGHSARRTPIVLFAATFTFMLALLSKPSMVAVPVALGLILFLIWERPVRDHALVLVGWALLTVPIIVINRCAQMVAIERVIGWPARFVVASNVLTFYVTKILFPWPLLIDYGRSLDSVLGSWSATVFLLPVGLFSLAILPRGRKIWLAVLGIFIAGVLPVLGFVPFEFQDISTVADRYVYFSLMAVALGIALFISQFRSHLAEAVTMTVIACYLPLSLTQLSYWRNSETLFAHTLRENPNSVVSHNSLGIILLDGKEYNRAAEHFRQAALNSPHYPEYRANWVIALEKLGRWSEVETQYYEILKHWPNSWIAYVGLSRAILRQGHYFQSLPYLEHAIRLQPSAPLYQALSVAMLKSGEKDEAVQALKEALQLDPNYQPAIRGLAAIQKPER